MNEINKNEMKPLEYPLEGVSLIEASAGTGKTYTIETLFLRLLMEKGYTVEQILVVTFTRLATAELQDRLRKVLNSLREALDESADKDERLSELLEKWNSMKLSDNEIRERCEDALRDFDRAPIFTIHGFCQRVLQENAFESGVRFGRELLDEGEASEIAAEGFRAFFRRQCYDAKHPLRTWLMTTAVKLAKPEDFQSKLGAVIGDAIDDNFIEGFDGDRSEANLEKIEGTLSAWIAEKEVPGYEKIREYLDAMESRDALARKADQDLYKKLPKRNGKRRELAEMLISYRATLLQLAKLYVTEYLKKAKSSRNFFTYNDLLQELRRRVEDSDELQRVIRMKYPCAIIDEFQDTDPVQNAIFQKLYADQDNSTFFMIGDPKQAIYAFRGGDLPAYLVVQQSVKDNGDKNKDEHLYSLDTNYRSSKEYIEAMNGLFDNGNLFNGSLHATVKAPESNAPSLLLNDQPFSLQALNVCITRKEAEGNDADEECMNAFNEIADNIKAIVQIQGLKVCVSGKERPVDYGDFAVLLKKATDNSKPENSPMKQLERLLTQRGIPCSTVGCVSVFSRPQAVAFQTFLQGLLECSDQRKAARLMALPFFGWTVGQVDTLRGNGLPYFQIWLGGLLEIWRSRSLLAMFEALLASTQRDILGEAIVDLTEDVQKQSLSIAEGLASSPKGNEALVIYRQLAEVLHTKAMEERLGPEGVLKAFEDGLARKDETNGIPEMEQLRLEATKPAVRIMTIHKSKGLQFPFVFVHGLLGCKVKRQNFYHTQDNRRIALVDNSMGGVNTEEHLEVALNETVAETKRLFYVAVTRARFLVRFVDQMKTNNFFSKYLNDTEEGTNLGDYIPIESDFTAKMSEYAQQQEVGNANKSVAPIQAEAADTIGFQLGWRTTSFSSLAPSRKMVEEATPRPERVEGDLEFKADDDQNEAPVALRMADPGPLAQVFLLARGEVAGTRWHKLFETLDFQGDGREWETEVLRQLQEYALLEDGWRPIRSEEEREAREAAALDMIQAVLRQRLPRPLPPTANPTAGAAPELLDFSLADIAAAKRRAELNFTYWLRRTGKDAALLNGLEDLLASHHIRMPEDWLRFPTGALTGSIDLLFQGKDGKFYLLDWKTNVIGNDLRNYWPNGLKAEMDRHCYHLQYLIYAAAFFHYYQGLQGSGWQLTREEYDRLFGGVFYVFLRGVSKESGTRGFFATRPSFELVKAVYEQLAVDNEETA